MYAAVDDLIGKLGDIFSELYGERDGRNAAECDLAAAAAEIDCMLSGRYQVPLTSPEALPLLKQWNIVLAEEMAWSRTSAALIPERTAKAIERVRLLLDRAAAGELILANAAPTTQAGAAFQLLEADELLFSREKMRRF